MTAAAPAPPVAIDQPGWRTAVYRLYNSAGTLLYVGMGAVRERLLAHAREKPWWPEVDPERTRAHWYRSRDVARRVEKRAIEVEKPLYNVLGTPEHGRRMLLARRRMVAKGAVCRRPMVGIGTPVAGTAEIADRLGVSRQRVQQLIARPDWPKPYVTLAMGKVWKTEEIEAWIRDHRPNDTGPEQPERETPLGRRHGRTKRGAEND